MYWDKLWEGLSGVCEWVSERAWIEDQGPIWISTLQYYIMNIASMPTFLSIRSAEASDFSEPKPNASCLRVHISSKMDILFLVFFFRSIFRSLRKSPRGVHFLLLLIFQASTTLFTPIILLLMIFLHDFIRLTEVFFSFICWSFSIRWHQTAEFSTDIGNPTEITKWQSIWDFNLTCKLSSHEWDWTNIYSMSNVIIMKEEEEKRKSHSDEFD